MQTDYPFADKNVRKAVRSQNPLWMPPGSVRSLITLIAVLIFCYGAFMAINYGKDIPDMVNTIVTTVIAFYFGTRSNSQTLTEIGSKIDNMQARDNVSISEADEVPHIGGLEPPDNV